MLNFYKRLSHNDKVQFWQIVTNVFLVIFTFWMGLSVQKMVVDNATKFNDNKTKVDYILPIYNKILSKETFIKFVSEIKTDSNRDIKSAAKNIQEWTTTNIDTVISDAKEIVELMSIFRYYVNDEEYRTISAHNSSILLNIKLIELFKYHIPGENIDIKNSLTGYINSEEYMKNVYHYVGGEVTKVISEMEDISSSLLSNIDTTLSKEIISPMTYSNFANNIFFSIYTNFVILKKHLEPNNNPFEFKFDRDTILILVLGIVFIIFIGYWISKLISTRVNVVSETDYKELKFKLGSYSAAYNGQECRIAELQKTIEARNNTINEYKELIKVWKKEYESLKEQIPSSKEQ